MSQDELSIEDQDELPIERGFPIERVNEIAQKESRAGMHYRPIYTMHKWWARRLGCVFRTVCLYALLDDPGKIDIREPSGEQKTISGSVDLAELMGRVSLSDPEALWDLYPKDVRVEDKKVLDPFMGGGTSLVEASRFGVDSEGWDLNPVAWFVTKKQLEAGQTDVENLEAAFEEVEEAVADEITRYYRTPCPNAATSDEPLDEDDPLGLNADFEYDVDEELRDDLQSHEHYADVMYNFWAKELDCVDCGATVPLFKDYRVAKGRYENDDKYNVFCPDCESIVLVDDWRSESTCSECQNEWTPENGTVSGADYACPDCGAQYGITHAIQEQGGFDLRLYAVEYYCPTCDEQEREQSSVKGYKAAESFDKALYAAGEQEWDSREDLWDYVPDEEIPQGHLTSERNPVFDHGYSDWTDMFNTRQLLSLARSMKFIDSLDHPEREYMLLTLSDSILFYNLFTMYNYTGNKIESVLHRMKSFQPQIEMIEGNLWGSEFGRGTFTNMFDMVKSGVEYANAPTERYVQNGENVESAPFDQLIGENTTIHQGDMREIDAEDEYDAVITDPPYYDNIMYSEVADYFYVWQKILLEDDYDWFGYDKTPRAESIVTNPFHDKTEEDFETELHEAFTVVRRALKEDGILAFTYHHSDSESWGELLAALCDVGFEVTATYPLSADVSKFITGDAVEFDILIVARPSGEREGISWPDLRQRIFETARETRARLQESRELSRGDIGVIEMGECFHEYSKHHGDVHREGEVMTAKEVVDEIYGIIQEASDIGTTEVFLDLLRENAEDTDAVNKLCRSANTRPEELRDQRLFNTDDGFALGTWDNEQRIAHIEDAMQEGDLDDLGKLQYLRYRYDREDPIGRYVQEWIDADLRELAGKLTDATGDEVYERMLDIRTDDSGAEGLPSGSGENYSIDDFS
jgi:adenine-specific DNA methylase